MKTFIEHDFSSLNQINTAKGRFYETPSGKKYPSVTSVLGMMDKSGLMEWRKRVGEEEANRVSARASNRGTVIHSLCEQYLYGKDPQPSMFDQYMFNSLKRHLDRIDEIHALETRLYSNYLQVAGTVDCVAKFDGKLSVIDFKTSGRVKSKEDIPGYFIQTSAYAVAFEELTGIPVSRLVIIMGVDNDDALVFTEKRDNWIGQFMELREAYGKMYNL